jgi:hypothetical protein
VPCIVESQCLAALGSMQCNDQVQPETVAPRAGTTQMEYTSGPAGGQGAVTGEEAALAAASTPAISAITLLALTARSDPPPSLRAPADAALQSSALLAVSLSTMDPGNSCGLWSLCSCAETSQ